MARKREKPIARVAGDLGIDGAMSRRWIQRARETAGEWPPPFPEHGRPRDEDAARCGRKSKRSGARRETSPHPKS
jgi:transposase-like protein